MTDAIPAPTRAALAAARQRSLRFARRWADSPARRVLAERFDRAATPDAAETAAAAVVADTSWLAPLLRPLLAELRRDPLFEPPVPARVDRTGTGIVLHECNVAQVVLSTQQAQPAPADSVVVPGRVRYVRYLGGGGGVVKRWRADTVDADWSAATAQPLRRLSATPIVEGLTLRLDGRTDGWQVLGAGTPITTVSVTLRAGSAPFAREYQRTDGRLLRVATLDGAAARAQMLLTLLRADERTDAAAVFEAATHDPAFFLRWDAMREWLALDAASALPRLRSMTNDPHDEVRTAARRTLERLAEPHPTQGAPCPA